MTETKRTVHLHIKGHVQGVYFRAWTADQARSRKIAGWVRNRRDGSVEAVVHGTPESVAAMIELCRRGPFGARVISLEVSEDSEAVPEGFHVLPTL